jgi:hypothetical protein
LRAFASGLWRKNSCQKPCGFSTSSSSYRLFNVWSDTEPGEGWMYLEERFIQAHDFGLKRVWPHILRQRRDLHSCYTELIGTVHCLRGKLQSLAPQLEQITYIKLAPCGLKFPKAEAL